MANVLLTLRRPMMAKLNIFASQSRLFLWWLAYRWASLLPALWLSEFTPAGAIPDISPSLFLIITVISTLLITLFSRPFSRLILENPRLLGLDTLLVGLLLAFSGATRSPYYLYALSPILAAALFFQTRGGLLAASVFTPFYLLTLLLIPPVGIISVATDELFTQLVGIWLLTLLFGKPAELLQQLRQAHDELTRTRDDLVRQNVELAAVHRQLNIIHDLTLLLQGAADRQSVQQRVLRVVTGELGFSQALVGLVNPITQRLESWQVQPPHEGLHSALTPMPLQPEEGLLVQAVLDRRGRWWSSSEQMLVADEVLNAWLSQFPWLILPLVLQEQPVGLLLVAAQEGPGSLTEDQLVVLTAVASQAATALGTIYRTQGLAVEQERNRIARDIHDTVAQSLFGTVFTLDACIKMLPHQAELVQQELVELRQLAEQVRQEVRRSIFDIWPSELTLEQFKVDLCKYVTHCAKPHAFHVDFTIGGDFDSLSPAIRRSLYRVSQEALTNVVHHAGVNSARLILYIEMDEVYLSIRDNGQGFDPKLVLAREQNRERFGLRGIQERAQALGGVCEILSQPNQGTQVLVRLPRHRRKRHG